MIDIQEGKVREFCDLSLSACLFFDEREAGLWESVVWERAPAIESDRFFVFDSPPCSLLLRHPSMMEGLGGYVFYLVKREREIDRRSRQQGSDVDDDDGQGQEQRWREGEEGE